MRGPTPLSLPVPSPIRCPRCRPSHPASYLSRRGLVLQRLERLAIGAGERETGNRGCLAYYARFTIEMRCANAFTCRRRAVFRSASGKLPTASKDLDFRQGQIVRAGELHAYVPSRRAGYGNVCARIGNHDLVAAPRPRPACSVAGVSVERNGVLETNTQ